ncbi:sup-9 [Pristionchus pacificus]|uniref:Sup-9 n=1 Tax=Pristionchus pacificus TaxID=54126 RepID=A0A2A6B9F6_PRIPA|nr:sup-9 [Pristionchus pacificus]|eukprot:PDM62493.1 sup-9 [Pristionchus pacificus]
MKQQNVRTLSLVVCTMTYLLIGAAVFDALESENELMQAGGKIFCMFYALAGIPLGLVCFQSIGERMNVYAEKVLRFIKRWAGKEDKVTHIDLIIVSGGLGGAQILIGAYAFHQYEGWSYFDSIYYCFTTLTTIGFGDFVALQKDGALQSRPEYVLFSIVFIILGLVIMSASMNLLVLRFLTMNTEDEKRDAREANLAARGLVRIRKNSRESDDDETSLMHKDEESTCSCSCYLHGGLEGEQNVHMRQRPTKGKERRRPTLRLSQLPPSFIPPP